MKRAVFIFTLLAVLAMAASGLAADQINPIKDAKVGEWALYEMTGGMQQKQSVVARDDNSVTIKIDIIMTGKVVNSATTKINFDQITAKPGVHGASGIKPTMGEESVEIKGKKVQCATMTMETQGRTMKSYMSKDVPVYGLVMTTMDGKPMMKLIDYGGK